MGTEPATKHQEVSDFRLNVGEDPSRLLFEDELTGIHNRRFLLSYFDQRVSWDSGSDFPLSLIITDLDEFKRVNDRHGHEAGDQVLTWLASLLTDAAGESGYAIRYGGDEFVLLLPGASRAEAQQAAYALLQQARDRPFVLRQSGTELPVSISIGVASAPDDATNSTGLLQAADTALYHAKRTGKNRVSAAWEIDPEEVFERTALHKLEATGLSGRAKELAIVSEALGRLNSGESTFLVVEGTPGLGKTAFLKAVEDQLTGNSRFRLVHLSGVQQESYRPYYLVAQILTVLLQDGEDHGAEILASLSDIERACLAQVLPQLAEDAADAAAERTGGPRHPADEQSLIRERIFTSAVHLIFRAAGGRPLVLLIDDLQHADEASLRLMRVLMERDELPVFVCGAALESLEIGGGEEAPPLERFLTDNQGEHDTIRVQLLPLSQDDIVRHLLGVFPGLKVPAGFVQDLVEITQGNPLFIGEIIRKLVTEQMLTFTGQEWRILPLDHGYLPRSLEEVVLQKISDLDSESRRLLEQASAVGEDVPVSVLTGSTDLEESKVLEFLDRAEALGLVKLGFQVDDEIMRFLSKRVMEISYGTIDEERRQELHGRVGAYQENLYQQRLLPSASLLAYHFKRSSDQDKARRYEQMQVAYQQKVFDPEEAAGYTGEPIEPEPETGEPLDSEALFLLPDVLRALLIAVRSIQLYPPGSDAIAKARQEALEAISAVVKASGRLNFSLHQRTLCVNGGVVDATEIRTLVSSFVDFLSRVDLRVLVFADGLTDSELRHLTECLAGLRAEEIVPGLWRSFALENEFQSIELRQIRFAAVRNRTRQHAEGSPAGPPLKEEILSEEDLTQIPNLLRALLSAATSVRLYPIGSEPVTTAVEAAHSSIQEILGRRASLSLASNEDLLLANGSKVNIAEQETLVSSFLELLRSVGLKSITISAGVRKSDLEILLTALRDLPGSGAEPQFWADFAVRSGLSNLSFNERQYAVLVGGAARGAQGLSLGDEGAGGQSSAYVPEVEVDDPGNVAAEYRAADDPGEHGDLTPGEGIAEETTGQSSWAAPGPPAEELSELPSDAIERFGKPLLVEGDVKVFRQLMRRLFENYQQQDPQSRLDLLRSCSALLDSLILALQHKFCELATDSLSAALSQEADAEALTELAILLNRMAEISVQFSDYELASRIYGDLSSRKEELATSDNPDLCGVADALDQELSQMVQDLLSEDLRSGETARLEKSARVLGSLGSPSIPLLIEAIKQEKDLRVRQLSAGLLSILGPEAVAEIKRALVLEVIVEQRFHILEVIDTVTRDLRDELTYCLGDVNPKIRRAAFRLAERLNEDDLIEILIPFVRDEDTNVAKGTIRSLAGLQSPLAVEAMASILESTKEPELAVACCQALGQIGDPSGIEPLEKVLCQKRFLIAGRRWNGQVRATAVLALRQINDQRATELLLKLADDRDPIIRQLARSGGAG